MATIDVHGNHHTQAGIAGAGQFQDKNNTAPAGLLTEANFAGAGDAVGEDLQQISVAQARRELSEGQRVQVIYPGREDDDPMIREVVKQSNVHMVTSNIDDDDAPGVYLDWAKQSALQDNAGNIVVEGQDGLPYVAFKKLAPDDRPADVPELALRKLDDVRTIRSTTDPDVLARYANTTVPGIQRELARNPNTDPDTITQMALGSLDIGSEREMERVQSLIERHPNADERALEVLSMSPSTQTRYLVATNRRTAERPTLDILARDKESGVRCGVGRNPNTRVDTLDLLAADKDPDVRQSVASNPSTRSSTLDRLSKSDGITMSQVAKNPSAPAATLTRLFADTSTGNQTRAMVAGNPSTPKELVSSAVHDEDSWVRQHAAKNPELSSAQVAQLARDKDSKVRRSLAANTHTAEQLGALSNDSDDFIRSSVARNPGTNAEALRRLADDSFHAVRNAVAEHPNTPRSVLETIAARDGLDGRIARSRLAQ